MRKSLDEAVTWKGAVAAIIPFVVMLAGFAIWVLTMVDGARAEARTTEHTMREAIERVEEKIDKVLWLLIEERKREGLPTPKEVQP